MVTHDGDIYQNGSIKQYFDLYHKKSISIHHEFQVLITALFESFHRYQILFELNHSTNETINGRIIIIKPHFIISEANINSFFTICIV